MTELDNQPFEKLSVERPAAKPVTAPHGLLWLAISVPAILILAMLAFFAGSYYSSQTTAKPATIVVDQTPVLTPEETPVDGSTITPAEVTSTAENLVIEWNDKQPFMIGNYHFSYVVYSGYSSNNATEPGVGPQLFNLGTVRGGIYDGYQLAQSVNGFSGMGVYYEWYYLLVPTDDTKKTVLLDRYVYTLSFLPTTPFESARYLLGDRVTKLDSRFVVIDDAVKIPELEFAQTARDSAGRSYHAVGVHNRTDYPVGVNVDAWRQVASLTDGAVLYAMDENPVMFVTVRADGATVYWDLDVPFFTYEDVEGGWGSYSSGVPQIYWNDGTANTKKYTKASFTGCGGGPTAVLDSALVTPNALKVAGSVGAGPSAGVKVYEWTALDNERTREVYNSIYWQDEPELTYEQFAATHPLFYYHDAFDRWIEFRTVEAIPAVECGKPVIYLYPETTTDLDVTLAPQGGFSYTEPMYNDGWSVTASPDGTLVNKADNKTYPYLFWEGRGGLYAEPEKYWVVARGDVDFFLDQTLTKLGLNAKETGDFIEFWGPRMKAAPYYKIGFHGTQVMDQLAPMSISQTPDSILRILMDYSELSAPIAENPPRLPPTFKRNGFTVVEWGGVIR